MIIAKIETFNVTPMKVEKDSIAFGNIAGGGRDIPGRSLVWLHNSFLSHRNQVKVLDRGLDFLMVFN